MKTVYLNENNVEGMKTIYNRESKSGELTIQLYSFHDINMKFLVVVTPPYIYHEIYVEECLEASLGEESCGHRSLETRNNYSINRGCCESREDWYLDTIHSYSSNQVVLSVGLF